MLPPVSVIIPTFNRAGFVRKAVDSVLAQDYGDFECIVVDDGSEDETPLLQSVYGDTIRYLRQTNKGPAAARNRGIEAARYDLIAFLDSDDWFCKDKLAIQVAAMVRQPQYRISHTNELWYRHGSILNQKKIHRKMAGNIFQQSLRLCAVSISTVILRRHLFTEIGLFDESLPCCEDYDFWLRASIDHEFLLIPDVLTKKDGGRSDQVSWQHRIGMDRFRIYSLEKILQTSGLTSEQQKLATEELIRKCTIYGKGSRKHGRYEEESKYLRLAAEYSRRMECFS